MQNNKEKFKSTGNSVFSVYQIKSATLEIVVKGKELDEYAINHPMNKENMNQFLSSDQCEKFQKYWQDRNKNPSKYLQWKDGTPNYAFSNLSYEDFERLQQAVIRQQLSSHHALEKKTYESILNGDRDTYQSIPVSNEEVNKIKKMLEIDSAMDEIGNNLVTQTTEDLFTKVDYTGEPGEPGEPGRSKIQGKAHPFKGSVLFYDPDKILKSTSESEALCVNFPAIILDPIYKKIREDNNMCQATPTDRMIETSLAVCATCMLLGTNLQNENGYQTAISFGVALSSGSCNDKIMNTTQMGSTLAKINDILDSSDSNDISQSQSPSSQQIVIDYYFNCSEYKKKLNTVKKQENITSSEKSAEIVESSSNSKNGKGPSCSII